MSEHNDCTERIARNERLAGLMRENALLSEEVGLLRTKRDLLAEIGRLTAPVSPPVPPPMVFGPITSGRHAWGEDCKIGGTD